VAALSRFASSCGTAFQLQDDILGLMGKEEKLGKPVGSDVREGKKTTNVYFALRSASESERDFLLSALGRDSATPDDVQKATQLIVDLGAVQATADLALEHVNKALPELEALPDSDYKELLASWAHFMINRSF
jgi:geranylgeranyl diphosphate synthase type I